LEQRFEYLYHFFIVISIFYFIFDLLSLLLELICSAQAENQTTVAGWEIYHKGRVQGEELQKIEIAHVQISQAAVWSYGIAIKSSGEERRVE